MLRPKRLLVPGLLAAAMAAGTGAVNLALAAPGGPAPVALPAYGPLWTAAANSVGKARGLVTTPALRRWAQSPEAASDLVTLGDGPLEATGHFQFGPQATSSFAYDALAADPGAMARAVFIELAGPYTQAPNMAAAARSLFPGPAGLETLLGDMGGVDQTPAATWVADYGLGGPAGVRYAAAHNGDLALIAALSAAADTASQSLALWQGLHTAAAQVAFMQPWTYTAPPAPTASLLGTATPEGAVAVDVSAYASLPYNAPAANGRKIAASLDRIIDKAGSVPQLPYGIPMALMQALLAADPHGYLARSVAAYDKVRKAPYFGLQRCHGSYSCWPYVYGRAQYDVPEELRGWPGFLAAYAGAPAAGDAAYRLGRVQELSGSLAKAVTSFDRAVSLPDGGITLDAAWREVWVLDTEMTPNQLEAMLKTARSRPLYLRVLYTLSVDRLREGLYSEAASGLERVARAIGTGSLVPLPQSDWPFAAAVRIQAAQAETLAALDRKAARAPTADARAAARYRMAAFMYHRTLLFYNQLWGGTFDEYMWAGNQPAEPTPAFVSFATGENNFIQAGSRFLALSRDGAVPNSLRASALFSYGMSLYSLESYNPAASVLFAPATLRSAIAATFGRFAASYPASTLAPEALTLQAAFTSNRKILHTLVSRYGTTSRGLDAAKDLKQASWPTLAPSTTGPVPLRPILATTPDVPSAILRWAQAPGPEVAARTDGPYTYIRVRPKGLAKGLYPTVLNATETAAGQVSVTWGEGPAAVGVARPSPLFKGYALVQAAGRLTVHGAQYMRGNYPVGSDTGW